MIMGEWEELPDDDGSDLAPFVVGMGEIMPVWFWNALVSGKAMPHPEPEVGDMDWCRPVLVKATGEVFPVGSFMQKGDLLSRSI